MRQKRRSMTVMRSGMILLSAALFAGLVWLLWRTVPWAAVRWGILALCAAVYAVVSATPGQPFCGRPLRGPGRFDVRPPAGGLPSL